MLHILCFLHSTTAFGYGYRICEQAYDQSKDVSDYNKYYHLRCANDLPEEDIFNADGKWKKLSLCQRRPISIIRHGMDDLNYVYVCTCGTEYKTSGRAYITSSDST